ncbi:hypothetical protein F5144DRAFT_549639 [Chaetomium tenue]|uniref:Uncharacterized protein n=1 Tax=Chaetomium tenue TaxID=1854479 RepID=A0ACB7P536_9PEZI|nr:hypothetical protein F5144DRAFT_549639 [Chaetomium globosum]
MTEQTHERATLLGLPTELRLQILEEAIAVRLAAPKSPSDIQNRRTRRYPYGPFLPVRGNINVYAMDTNDAKSAQPSLLATNRQIRKETQYIVGRVSGDPYRLDIMLLGVSGLMPTWVSRPCLVKRSGLFPSSRAAGGPGFSMLLFEALPWKRTEQG